MTVEDDIYAMLRSKAGVIALVQDRIYPDIRPQGDPLPAIVYHRVSQVPVVSHQGFSGISSQRFQFNCWADTPEGSIALVNALISGIRCASYGDIHVALHVNTMADEDETTGDFLRMADFIIWYAE